MIDFLHMFAMCKGRRWETKYIYGEREGGGRRKYIYGKREGGGRRIISTVRGSRWETKYIYGKREGGERRSIYTVKGKEVGDKVYIR